MATHKALGKGINALFGGDVAPVKPQQNEPEKKELQAGGVTEIPINNIHPNRHQPRTHFNEEALEELSQSIKVHGLAQPLVVTERPEKGEYELVVGERRLRASKKAGLATVPCMIKSMTNRERFELALIENIQRQDLGAMEEARAIDGLMNEYDLTQDQIAEALGKSRSTIANTLRFLKLHEKVQEALQAKDISDGHAKILAGVQDHAEQLRWLQKIVSDKLTVRDLDALLGGGEKSKKKSSSAKSSAQTEVQRAEIKKYEEEIQRQLGRRVEIQSNGKKGWLKFAFYSPWDLDNLCQSLGVRKDGEDSQ